MARGYLVYSFLLSVVLGMASLDGQTSLPNKSFEPPFGLRWGEPPAGLVDWAAKFKLDVTVKALGHRPLEKTLIVSAPIGSLPDHESTSVEARFVDGKLFEVSIHYTYPGKSPEFVRGRYEALSALLTKQFGPMTFNGRKKSVSKGVSTESEAFHVEPGAKGSFVMLALTEVRDVKRGDAAARFSLVYHNGAIKGTP